MASTYNHGGIEQLVAEFHAVYGQLEDTAAQLMTQAGIIADGTQGAAADMHSELAHSQEQTSQKAREVITEVSNVTTSASEQAASSDATGAASLAG